MARNESKTIPEDGQYPIAEHVDCPANAEQLASLFAPAMSVNREGIVITDSLDPGEPIIYVNQGFQRITGYAPGDVIGRNCRFLQGPQTDPEQTNRIRQAIREGRDVVVQLLNYRKDGSTFWNLVSITPIYNAAGKVVHRIGLQLDVTKRREAELALEEANELLEQRVEQRTAELRQANQALRKEVRERRQAERSLLENQQHLRKLASQLSSAEDRQRRQIASDLHDRLSQGLVALKFQLETLLARHVPPERLSDFAGQLDVMDSLVEETRTMMFDLCPPMLYDLGLAAAVEELLRQFQKHTQIHCEFVDDGLAAPLSSEMASFLYRSVREMLINVRKHARAENVVVSISHDRKTLSVSVADDGAGMTTDLEAEPRQPGEKFGLFSIRERLNYFGGWLLQETAPGQGTNLTMIVPIAADSDADQPDRETT
ncbi:MAG: PAS domain-containing protein [Phycisphaerae bacterium]